MVFGIQNLTARVGLKCEVGERLDSHIRCIISMIGSKRLERGDRKCLAMEGREKRGEKQEREWPGERKGR